MGANVILYTTKSILNSLLITLCNVNDIINIAKFNPINEVYTAVTLLRNQAVISVILFFNLLYNLNIFTIKYISIKIVTLFLNKIN